MNFLELVQDVARQSGTLAGGVTLASVSGVTGRTDKIVDWVKSAWDDIQSQRDSWRWLRAEFTSALVINDTRYTAANFGVTRFARWARDTRDFLPFTIYDNGIGQSDEAPIRSVAYDAWRSRYDRGTHDATRPTVYAVSPANEFCVGAKPDKAYVIRGEYWKGPQALAADTDTPEMPARFHKLIVWRAMMYLGEADESPATLQAANNEYQRMFRLLCNDQLPDVDLTGNALA